MSKKIVKRCIRPQCMEIYREDNSNKYCACGAFLLLTEIEEQDSTHYKSGEKVNASTESGNSTKSESGDGQSETLGYLYLLPEDEEEKEVEFKLGRRTIVGRSSDTMTVDVDLSQFGGLISRKHVLITCEEDGFYVTNLSENHSVHVNNKVVVRGNKMKLESEDGIILSKKVLLQFEEVNKWLGIEK